MTGLAAGLTTVMAAALFLTVAWAMLTGSTGPAEPDVFARALAAAPAPDADVLPFKPGPHYHDLDDWTADLPTTQLAAVIDAPRHTSPSETAAATWPPIFAQLAAELGYDTARGFDGTPTTELVAA